MKAKEGVIEYLRRILTAELTAVHQYLLHAGLCKSWGYMRLQIEAVATGINVKQLFESDLNFERNDVDLLREAIAHCANVADFTTRHILEHMLIDTEEHIDWFETQLRIVEQIGLERYLSEQM